MRPATLREAVARVLTGEPEDVMLAEFVDTFYLTPGATERLALLAEEPRLTGDQRLDAYIGGIAEYLAHHFALEDAPAWAFKPERYLDRPWHTTPVQSPGIIEYLTWASPAEFKSRNIFTDEEPVRRARKPVRV